MGFGSGGEGFTPGRNDVSGDFTVQGNISASVNVSSSAFYGDGSNLTNIGGGSLTITIGNTVASGAGNRILYESSANKLAESTNLTFDGTTLTVATLDANGGAIDGTTIGANSTAAATVTDLTCDSLTATANLDIGAYRLTAETLESDVASGTAPMVVASNTVVTNLNADLLDGKDWGTPNALGSSTPAAVSATTLSGSGNADIDGTLQLNNTVTVKSGVSFAADTVNIDGGNIDGCTIATSDVTVGAGKTLDVSAGTLTTSTTQDIATLANAASNNNANLDFGAYDVRAQTLTSDVTTGTAPLTVSSTTVVLNLNTALLDGSDWLNPSALGSGTPAAVSATTLSGSGTLNVDGNTALNGNVTLLNGGTGVINIDGFATVAALGSNQGDAAAVTKYYNKIDAADNTKGVVLPASAANGRIIIIWNASVNTLEVYPNSGGTINGESTNVAVTVAAGLIAHCICATTDTWVCMGAS